MLRNGGEQEEKKISRIEKTDVTKSPRTGDLSTIRKCRGKGINDDGSAIESYTEGLDYYKEDNREKCDFQKGGKDPPQKESHF